MNRTMILAGALGLALHGTASAAGQADICYGPAQPLGSTNVSTSATVFTCPIAGIHTLPELAALGWTVVQLVPVVISATQQADQIVIQKP